MIVVIPEQLLIIQFLSIEKMGFDANTSTSIILILGSLSIRIRLGLRNMKIQLQSEDYMIMPIM
jgi:hypothetical protein